jgi:hypothetical protein
MPVPLSAISCWNLFATATDAGERRNFYSRELQFSDHQFAREVDNAGAGKERTYEV